ncbi:MAG TPA: hypothetical protein VHH54_04245 [Actinomycetota bacterium]|nr:hypothetical protein [Actinomycetota bacterium]
MNIAWVVAGSLALLGAAIHGGAGEIFVVRKLSPRELPASPFGGGGMTKAMIRAAWHMATIALLTVGFALVLSGSVLRGDIAQAIGVFAAASSTAIGVLVGAVAFARGRRALAHRATDRRELRGFLHPGPAILIAIPVLAWVGLA